MNRRKLSYWWLAVAVFAGSCADDRLAGKGSAGETTNGIVLEGRLTKSDGSPAARVAVLLGKPETDSVFSSAVTDDSGVYALSAPAPGRYQVRSRIDSIAALGWVSVGTSARQKLAILSQSRLSSMRGSVAGEVGDPATLVVRIPGLGLESNVRQDLTWSVDGVPAGWHLAQIVRSGGGVEGEITGSTYVPNTMQVSKRVFTMIDDFEADQGQGRLVHLLDGSWWGRWNDTSMNADSSRTWKGTEGLATDSSAWSGKSLRVPMRVGPLLPQRPNLDRSAGLEIKIGGREDLDSQSVWFDLTKIDSIVFQAKGTGSIDFLLKARSGSDRAKSGFFRKSIVLQPTWTRYAFAASAFAPDNGLIWSTSQGRELYWTTPDSQADLWLDDIELVGLRPSDLLRR